MPITIQPATLKVKKENGQYQSADCLKGDKGDPGSVGIIAPDYANLTFPIAQGQPCIHDGLYYIANTAIQASEAWTAAHWTQLTVGEQQQSLLNAIQGVSKKELLRSDEIENTTQEIVFDQSTGNVSQINHIRNNTAIRTDVFTFGTNTITEVRTLSTGETLTIETNTITLETTVTYADAA